MTIQVRVAAKQLIADKIVHLTIESVDAQPLPKFAAGAHIDLHIDNDTVRQYSLLPRSNDAQYEIAVLKEQDGRGGSVKVHDLLQPGDEITIGGPRNHFPLEDAEHSILIAGGIGITPILAMADELSGKQASFELHYCSRSKASAAFLQSVQLSRLKDHSHFYFDDQGMKLDNSVFSVPAHNKRIFVCGPEGFINFVRDSAAAMGWPDDRVHFELFQKTEGNDTGHGSRFSIRVDGADQTVEVAENETALEALERSGFEIPCSCEQGICGTCAVELISGIPDHQDMYLTDKEREDNTKFIPCCSRAESEELTIRLP